MKALPTKQPCGELLLACDYNLLLTSPQCRTRSGPAYNSYKSAHPRRSAARRRNSSDNLCCAARHAIHAATIHAATRWPPERACPPHHRPHYGADPCWRSRMPFAADQAGADHAAVLGFAATGRTAWPAARADGPGLAARLRTMPTNAAGRPGTDLAAATTDHALRLDGGAAWTTLALRTGKGLAPGHGRRDRNGSALRCSIDAVAIRLVMRLALRASRPLAAPAHADRPMPAFLSCRSGQQIAHGVFIISSQRRVSGRRQGHGAVAGTDHATRSGRSLQTCGALRGYGLRRSPRGTTC